MVFIILYKYPTTPITIQTQTKKDLRLDIVMGEE